MKRFSPVLFMTLIFSHFFPGKAQVDFTLTTKRTETGYAYVYEPMETDIRLTTQTGEPVILSVDSPTLVQIWSICCGGDEPLWQQQRDHEQKYQSRGLRTVSVNFENGKGRKQQQQDVAAHLEKKPHPKELYLDTMGWAIDSFKVKGFPTYLLIDAQGTILFRTSAHDEEGLIQLENELDKLLASP